MSIEFPSRYCWPIWFNPRDIYIFRLYVLKFAWTATLSRALQKLNFFYFKKQKSVNFNYMKNLLWVFRTTRSMENFCMFFIILRSFQLSLFLIHQLMENAKIFFTFYKSQKYIEVETKANFIQISFKWNLHDLA